MGGVGGWGVGVGRGGGGGGGAYKFICGVCLQEKRFEFGRPSKVGGSCCSRRTC